MSRKNTLLIAVMVNLGLLMILFFTATRQSEEKMPVDPSAFLVENEIPIPETHFIESPPIETPVEKKEAEIVHKLPEVMPQKEEEPIKEPIPIINEVTVKKGDSLDKIAKNHLVSVDEIIEVNRLKTTVIRIGQVLKIPMPKEGKKSTPKKIVEKGEYYIVKPGDNPWTIAMKHHMKTEDLLRLNNLDNEKAKKLRPGDRLKIR